MGRSHRLASRCEDVCASAAASARCGTASTSSAAATGSRTDTTAGESAADVQWPDPGESADTPARTIDEPERVRHRSGWRHPHLPMGCAGWNVQLADWDEYDVDRAEPGRQLPADRYGQRRTGRHREQLDHDSRDATDRLRRRALRLRHVDAETGRDPDPRQGGDDAPGESDVDGHD